MTLRKGIISTFVSKTGVALLGLLMVIVISRYLGAEGRGRIALFMSSVALLQMFCDFGNSSVLINLSYTRPQRSLWLSSILWVGAVCLLAYPFLRLFGDLPFAMLVPPAAFLYSMINLQQMLLMGRQRVAQRNLSMLLLPFFIIPGFLLLFNATSLGTAAYPAALFIALGISALVSRFMVSDLLQADTEGFSFQTEVLKQGSWVQGAQALQFLNYRLNFFLVAWFISDAALGIYNNAVILCESVWILGHSIGQMQHMKILNSTDERAHVMLSRKLMLWNFGGSLLLCIILLAIPNILWTRLFGAGFSEMSALFVYLIPGVLCFSISNIINHFMHARGLFKQILICNAFGLLCGLSASLLLIPSYGLEGACVAWSAGLAAAMLFYLFRFKLISDNICGNR